MALDPPSTCNDVHGISDDDKERIRAFIQGLVYAWCQVRPNAWFSMRILMGDVNNDWRRTPLQALYDRFIAAGEPHESARTKAGQASGWLLKRVLTDDKRTFEHRYEEMNRQYLWKP